eukprot:15083144-Alexandrium_andersonii.AAC.1
MSVQLELNPRGASATPTLLAEEGWSRSAALNKSGGRHESGFRREREPNACAIAATAATICGL